jgi:hypothetical protein
MEKYYTSDDLQNGIDNLPKINKTTQRNLRQKRKLQFTKIGRECHYTKEWIENYIKSNIVVPIRQEA